MSDTSSIAITYCFRSRHRRDTIVEEHVRTGLASGRYAGLENYHLLLKRVGVEFEIEFVVVIGCLCRSFACGSLLARVRALGH